MVCLGHHWQNGNKVGRFIARPPIKTINQPVWWFILETDQDIIDVAFKGWGIWQQKKLHDSLEYDKYLSIRTPEDLIP